MWQFHQSESKLVNQILDMPTAPVIVRRVNKSLKDEQKKRKKFYEEVTEQQKAEFIN